MSYVFFFKQKTAYEMRISDWSSDVCSSDLQKQAAEDLARTNKRAAEDAQRDREAEVKADAQREERDRETIQQAQIKAALRSEERRVGKESGSTCRYWWSP